ncbi:MAG: VIT1/CCC1 transporter family protein [bacterium]|nr:VIT1/CCC1 transporter family protein [bacterium]
MNYRFNPRLLKAAVYGANDGIVTTFAVVAGVSGAHLAASIIVILGIANMIADGMAMGFGDYLGERSEQNMRQKHTGHSESKGLWKSGLVTFIAFVIAGSMPLLPYFARALGAPIPEDAQFNLSIFSTAGALFLVGSLRTRFEERHWIYGGLEMLGVGAIAAVAAYVLGGWVETMIR